MKIKRFWHVAKQAYIMSVDAYGVFLHWSETDGNIHDVKVKFHDTHPSYGNVIEAKSDYYDIEDIDLKTFLKQIDVLINYFKFKPVEIQVPSAQYKGTTEKRYVLASNNRMILKILELIKFYVQHPTGDIL